MVERPKGVQLVIGDSYRQTSQVKPLPPRRFPRGPGPLVSVLLPTRGRPERLKASVASLYRQAECPEKIECLLRVDADDAETLVTAARLGPAYPNVVATVGPRGNGYADMHEWVNTLAATARGDWLLLWNDDCLMLTEAWDRLIAHCYVEGYWHGDPRFFALLFNTEGRPHDYGFMAVRREVVRVLGHYSLIPLCDTWMYELLSPLDCVHRVPCLAVRHLQDFWDRTFLEGDVPRMSPAYTVCGLPYTVQRLRDSVRLLEFILAKEVLPGE